LSLTTNAQLPDGVRLAAREPKGACLWAVGLSAWLGSEENGWSDPAGRALISGLVISEIILRLSVLQFRVAQRCHSAGERLRAIGWNGWLGLTPASPSRHDEFSEERCDDYNRHACEGQNPNGQRAGRPRPVEKR